LSIVEDFTIAIVYNSESKVFRGVAQDLLALKSTSDTANAIVKSLTTLGYRIQKIEINGSLNAFKRELIKLNPQSTLVFNLCDGFKGEITDQACITQLINALSIPQTGSTEDTIIKCTDKARAKEILVAAGLRTPPYQVFKQPSGPIELHFPVIVKPLYEDGSIGINLKSVAQTSVEMFEQIVYVLKNYDQPALVEEFIPGRELSVSLWGNEKIEALPIVEHDFSLVTNPLAHLLTYQTKWITGYYEDQNIILRCPADLTETIKESIIGTAILAYRALGLRDFGRIDFRFFNETPFILDINEIPDLHPETGFAMSAKAAGLSYEEMIQKILEISFQRTGLLCLDQNISSQLLVR
jgi:D-alanine-D-alanine ligase